jgi:hypothetical protein
LQEDGTLQELVSDEAVLTRMLAPLGGNSSSSTDAAATTSSNGSSAAAAGSSSPAGTAAAAGAGVASASSSSGRDPDDSVREALAEAIAVLVRWLAFAAAAAAVEEM